MNCRELRNVLLDVLDGNVEAGMESEVTEHLASCSSCRREVAEHRTAWRLLECLPDADVDAARLDAMADAAVGRPARPRLVSHPRWRWAVSVAAAVLLVALVAVASRFLGGGPETTPDGVAQVTGSPGEMPPAWAELPEFLREPAFLDDFEVIVALPELAEEGLGELLDLDDEELFFLQVVGEVPPS